jgi:hypothetical protein
MLLGTSTQCGLGPGGQVADQYRFHSDPFDIAKPQRAFGLSRLRGLARPRVGERLALDADVVESKQQGCYFQAFALAQR